MKNEVRKVDLLLPEDEKTYNLSKSEALERLKAQEISESEQMLNKWCRDGVIDAVRVAKGHPKNRGLRISEKSLDAFIASKKGNVEDLLTKLDEKDAEIEILKQQLKEARREIKELKENGVVVKKEKTINLESFSLSSDTIEATFKYKRAIHHALFDEKTGEVFDVSKNTKGKGQESVFAKLTDEEKTAINEARKIELEKQ